LTLKVTKGSFLKYSVSVFVLNCRSMGAVRNTKGGKDVPHLLEIQADIYGGL
jgi:hypothetical protein